MNNQTTVKRFALATAIGLFSIAPMRAADLTWDGGPGATGTDINTAANWSTDVLPGAADNVHFGATGPTNPVMSGNITFNKLIFDPGAPSYNIVGADQNLTLVNNQPVTIIENQSSQQQVITVKNALFSGTIDTGTVNGGDIVLNTALNVGNSSTAANRYVGLAGSHNIYFNVDTSINAAGIVGGGAWTSSTTTAMHRRFRGRVSMADFSGTAFLGNIGTTFQGSFHLNSTTNGALRLTHNNSLGDSTALATGIHIYGGTTGNSTLELVGNINVSRGSIWMDGRSGAVATDPHILNVSGNNTFNILSDIGAGIETPITATAEATYPQANSGNWNIQSDAGKLTIAGGLFYNFFQTGVTPVPITLQLRGAGDGEISSKMTVVSPTVPSINVVKNDGGTWTFSNSANDYTGTTTITGGVLSLGTTGTIASSTVIDVQSAGTFRTADLPGATYTLGGANPNPLLNQALKGNGTIVGGITANANIITPGVTGAGTGALTINGNFTLNGGSTLAYELTNNPAGANDKLIVNGNVNLNGSNIIAVTKLNTSLGSGSYTLVDYSGTLSGTPTFTLSGVGGGTTRQTFNVVNDAINTLIKLDVAGNAANLTWVGNGSTNVWDVVGATNWTGAPDQKFFDGDNVTFSDSGSNSPAISVSSTVQPGQIVFSNSSAKNYTFTGGTISTPSIATTGTGSVTFNNSDIVATTVSVGNASSVLFQSSGNTTINGAMTSTSSGNITISNGSFATVGNFTNSGTGNVNVSGNGFQIGGTLTQSGSGTTTIGNTGTLTLGGMSVSGGGTIAYTRSGDETLSTALSGNGNFRKQVGTGTTTLSGANGTFTGNIYVDSGTLKMGSVSALGSVAAMTTVANGAVLDLNGKNAATSANVTIAGSGIGGTGALTNTSTAATSALAGRINGLTLSDHATMSVGFAGATDRTLTYVSTYLHGQGKNITVSLVGHGNNEIDWVNVGETNLANINVTTTVAGASLYIGGTTTLGSAPGKVLVSNNAKMGFYMKDAGVTHTKEIEIDATGGGIEVDMGSNNPTAITNLNIASPIKLTGAAAIDQFSPTTLGLRSFTLSGPITGDGQISFHAGTTSAAQLGVIQISSDLNTYTSPTIISGGFGAGVGEVSAVNDRVVLAIGDGGMTGKLGANDVTINSAGILRLNRSNAHTVSNNISGPGNLEHGGTGVGSLSGVNTYTGTTTVNAGTLKFAKQVSLYNNGGAAAWDDAHIVVNTGGTLAVNVGGTGEFTLTDVDNLKVLGTATGGFKPGSSIGIDTTNAGAPLTYASVISDTNTGANSIGFAKLGSGTLNLSATNTYTGNTTVSAGTLNITGNHTTGANYSVASGANLITKNVRATSTLTVNGTATINQNGLTAGASKVETLTIGAGGKLNLKDNDLVVGTAPNFNAVRTAIIAGKTNNAAAGITSDMTGFGISRGFGYAMGNDAKVSSLLAGSLSGQAYDADSVLVKYTLLGDADLDGDTDLNDLGLWSSGYTGDLGVTTSPTTFWTNGDFDYDGDTDLNDLGLWSSTYTGDFNGGPGSLVVNAPGASPEAVAILNSMGITVVPEPSTFVLAGVGLAGLVIASRRRKK